MGFRSLGLATSERIQTETKKPRLAEPASHDAHGHEFAQGDAPQPARVAVSF